MTAVTVLELMLLGCLLGVIAWLAVNIWAALRCYRRERQWEELAQTGDVTAKVILQLREKP